MKKRTENAEEQAFDEFCKSWTCGCTDCGNKPIHEAFCKNVFAAGAEYRAGKDTAYWHNRLNEVRLTMRIVRKIANTRLKVAWSDKLFEASERLSDQIEVLIDIPEQE